MTDLIEEAIGARVDVRMDIDDVRKICLEHGVTFDRNDWGIGKLILELYEKTVESRTVGADVRARLPAGGVAAVARSPRDARACVERFEAVVAGREIANAFSELTDPVEQRARFEEQARPRRPATTRRWRVDDDYIRALEYGLPPTGGMGLGIDRVVQLLTGTTTIKDVILFPTLRPEVTTEGG